MNEAYVNDKKYKYLSLAFSIIGFLATVIVLINGYHFSIGMIMCVFGITAFVFSRLSNKKILTLISILAMTMYFSVFLIASYTGCTIWKNDMDDWSDEPIEIAYTPEYTMYLPEGRIYSMLELSNSRVRYFFIGDNDYELCDTYNNTLENVMTKLNAYSPNNTDTERDRYYYYNHSYIYFYDTSEMPPEEVTDVLETLGIDTIPCLIRVENGSVVSIVLTTDEQQMEELFLN
ncbi:MAG: hypothetical protein FWG88_05770 [Oscillospiraceae bacterium]|nr:hypothetical protein [Oscillospiraceae bacterium]